MQTQILLTRKKWNKHKNKNSRWLKSWLMFANHLWNTYSFITITVKKRFSWCFIFSHNILLIDPLMVLIYLNPICLSMENIHKICCSLDIVHNCTIFLCSLDVRNIVQGGDPLYAAVNHKQGCGGHNWPKLVQFFLQKHLPISPGRKICFFRTPTFHFWAKGVFFRPLGLAHDQQIKSTIEKKISRSYWVPQ